MATTSSSSSSPLSRRKAGLSRVLLRLGVAVLLLCIAANSCAASYIPLPDESNGVKEGGDKFYCFSGFTRCTSGIEQCVKLEQECNGIKDCPDGSDEGDHCKSFDCEATGRSTCLSGRMCMNITTSRGDVRHTLYTEYLCDGVKDCADGSDEDPSFCASYDCNTNVPHKPLPQQLYSMPPPPMHRTQCPSGKGECVAEAKLCDGVVDCVGDGGSDEGDEYCKKRGCSPSSLSYLFQCASGRCISRGRVCDGKQDCPDGDDEGQFCEKMDCLLGLVKCAGGTNRTCIDLSHLCDGVEDCPGGTDEKGCNASICGRTGSSVCPSGKECSWDFVGRCDGVKQCIDGSDEDPTLCRTYNCSDYGVKCKDGVTCIGRKYVCDGVNDCPDKSDEDPAFCRTYNCSEGEVKCKDGVTCIGRWALCNGQKNCPDKSDEDPVFCRTRHNCSSLPSCAFPQHAGVRCPGSAYVWCTTVGKLCDGVQGDCYGDEEEKPEFCTSEKTRNLLIASGRITCRNDTTLFRNGYYCDGIQQCEDGSDESDGFCRRYQCPEGRVKCYGKWCLTGRPCDGKRDCPDGSDEKGCST